MKNSAVVTLAQLAEFDEVIDVRSPAEYADDHVRGAANCPVLDDAQRAEIGTLYKQVSTFEARKRGAALVAQNIAHHLQSHFAGRDRDWKPLVYCWRGGKRSEAMTHVLRQVGWNAAQLEGGYKSYRREVVAMLATLPQRLSYRVVCGVTGSGKSRMLAALKSEGAQILDLESLARHRGSVLGSLPEQPQPSQKGFDSALWDALRSLDPGHPVFVEAESKKIGDLRVPDSLIHAMWSSPCVRIELPFPLRVALLMEDYRHFFHDPDDLCAKLDGLASLHGKSVIEGWKAQAHAGNWQELVSDLLTRHYDPAYRRSAARNYPALANAIAVDCHGIDGTSMRGAARTLLRSTADLQNPA